MVGILSFQSTIEQCAYRKILAKPNFELSDVQEQNALIRALYEEALSASFWCRPIASVFAKISGLHSRVVSGVNSTVQTLTNRRVAILASSAFFSPYLEANFGLQKADFDRLVSKEMLLLRMYLKDCSKTPDGMDLKRRAQERVIKRLLHLSEKAGPVVAGDIYLSEMGFTPRRLPFQNLCINGQNAYALLKNTGGFSHQDLYSLLYFAKEKWQLPIGDPLYRQTGQWLSELDKNGLLLLRDQLRSATRTLGPFWDYDPSRNLDSEQRPLQLADVYACRTFQRVVDFPGKITDKTRQSMGRKFEEDLQKKTDAGLSPSFVRDISRFSGKIVIGSAPFDAPDPYESETVSLARQEEMVKALQAECQQDLELVFVGEIAAAQEFELEVQAWISEAWKQNSLLSDSCALTPPSFISKKITKIPNCQGLEVEFDVDFTLQKIALGKPVLAQQNAKVRLELIKNEKGEWERSWTWKGIREDAV